MQSSRTHSKPRAKLKPLFWVFLFSSALAFGESRWVWMVEPSFMDYKVRRPIEGSRRTILALARVGGDGIVPAEGGNERPLALAMKDIGAEARATAEAVLATLEPRFVRDKNGVILYAVMESPNPLTASAVLAPGFPARFAKTLGPDLLVAMPNRFQILVFSRQDDAFRRVAEDIVSGYLGSNYPVSREVFALEDGKLRSTGEVR
jgi:hypothetical protein